MLEKLKNQFNRQQHSKLHPEVVGTNVTEIPSFNGILLYGYDNIHVEGNVTTQEGTVVQRGTSIVASPGKKVSVGAHAPVMDYVKLHATEHDISIGKRVTIAHGSHLVAQDSEIDFADDSFGNILIRVTGGKLEEYSYIGPGTELTAGEVIPKGAVFFGSPKYQASIRTDTKGNIVEGAQRIMRMNIRNTSQSLHDSRGNPLTANGYSSYEEWVDALQKLAKTESSYQIDLPFEKWLRPYSLKQVAKAAEYMKNEAEFVGPVIWYSPSMQSDIIAMAKARDVLTSQKNPMAKPLGDIIKSHAFMLGIYTPQKDEIPALTSAYLENAPAILEESYKALGLIEHPIELQSHNRESAVSVVTGVAIPKAELSIYRLYPAHLRQLADRLQKVQQHIVTITFPARNKNFVHYIPESPVVFPTGDVRDMSSMKARLNPHAVNMYDIQDGSTVRTYDGAIPSIHKDAVLAGKVDITGSVRIDAGAVIQNSTIRTEQRVIPAIMESNSVARNVIFHTASREQHPVVLGKGAIADGTVDSMVCLHGAYIANGSYIAQESVVPDEVRLRGVVLPKTVVDPSAVRDAEHWAVYGGNLSTKGLARKDIAKGQLSLPQPLATIDLMDEMATKSAIDEMGLSMKREAEHMVKEKTLKYGNIYKHSPYMQIDLLSLKTTSRLLSTSPETDQKVLQGLKYLQEGYEYLLGTRDVISAPAAAIFRGEQKRVILQAAQKCCAAIAIGNPSGVSIPAWPNEAETSAFGAIGYDTVHGIAMRSIHPSFKSLDTSGKAAERAVDECLHRNFFYPPEEIRNLSVSLGRIADNIKEVSKDGAVLIHSKL